MQSPLVSVDNMRTLTIDAELESRLQQLPVSPHVLIGLLHNTNAYVVANVRVPAGPMSVKWISTFIRQLAGMMPGGIAPIGVLNGEADFTNLLEVTSDQSKLRCQRHTRSSKVNVAVKSQSKLTESLHCFQTCVSLSFPLSSSDPVDFKRDFALWLENAVPVLNEPSSGSLTSATNSPPLTKFHERQHNVVFQLSTLQNFIAKPKIGSFTGAISGIAYQLPHVNLSDAVAALKADLIITSVYRWNLFKEFNVEVSDEVKGGTIQLPKRVLFVERDSQLRFSDYVFPDESLDEVNYRLQEYIGLPQALQSLENSVETFLPVFPKETRNSAESKLTPESSGSKRNTSTLMLLAILPIIIAVAFLIVMKPVS